MRTESVFVLTAFVVVACILLGGGTRGGFLSDAILEAVSLPLLLAGLWLLLSHRRWQPRLRGSVFFCALLVLVPLLQLIPLPPAVWTALPHRTTSVEAFDIAGRSAPWMPASVFPQATWLSLLSLIPPLAVFLATAQLCFRDRRRLSLVLLGVGVVSVFLGLLQVAQGPSSPLRFFEFTNLTEAVGFFANRNHYSALLYCLLLFTAAWTVHSARQRAALAPQLKFGTAAIAPLLLAFTVLVALVGGQAMARSRAGLALTMVALVAATALAFSGRREEARGTRLTPARLVLGASALAVLFAVQFALYRVMERFAADPLQDARIPFARNTMEAAWAYMPWGSGLGTFVRVYGMFEKPENAMPYAYANHAHNDILELWLEAGVAGLFLMGLFVVWLRTRSFELWRRASRWGQPIDKALARAATIAIALLVAHSFVDYPLRTGGMMGVLAFAAALLIPPTPGRTHEDDDAHRVAAAHVGAPAAARPVPAGAPAAERPVAHAAEAVPPQAGSRWGEAIEWPEAWRKGAANGNRHKDE